MRLGFSFTMLSDKKRSSSQNDNWIPIIPGHFSNSGWARKILMESTHLLYTWFPKLSLPLNDHEHIQVLLPSFSLATGPILASRINYICQNYTLAFTASGIKRLKLHQVNLSKVADTLNSHSTHVPTPGPNMEIGPSDMSSPFHCKCGITLPTWQLDT